MVVPAAGRQFEIPYEIRFSNRRITASTSTHSTLTPIAITYLLIPTAIPMAAA